MSETDRKLKDQLNTNQAARERMCLELLRTQRHFTDVRPRLPKGGPDGGRDIEALYDDRHRAVGAVGFVNDATDTREHREKAQKKFADELQNALAIPPGELEHTPTVFVFFTNVALTPGIIDGLKQVAYASSITKCEVYDRERLRLMLDCNTGYAIRQRYLDIPLTDAEQKDFFDNWGDEIQVVISQGIQTVKRTTDRLLFLAEAQVPVDDISVIVKLDCSLGDVSGGEFLFQTQITILPHVDGLFSLIFGSASDPILYTIDQLGSDEKSTRTNTQQGYTSIGLLRGTKAHMAYKRLFSETDSEPVDETDHLEWFTMRSSSARLDIRNHHLAVRHGSTPFFERFTPACRLIDLHRCHVIFQCDAAIANHITELRLSANQYELMCLERQELAMESCDFSQFHLPEKLDHIDSAREWRYLRPSGHASLFSPDFNVNTPARWLPFDK